MIVFNLSDPLAHPESFKTTDGSPWIGGEDVDSYSFTASIRKVAETLPEGEHTLAVLAEADDLRGSSRLRLARVRVRHSPSVSIEAAAL